MKSLLFAAIATLSLAMPAMSLPAKLDQTDVDIYRYALEEGDEDYSGGTIRATRLMTEADGSNWVAVYITPKACKANEKKNQVLMHVLREAWNQTTNYGKPTEIIAITPDGCKIGALDTEGQTLIVYDKDGNPKFEE